MLGKNSSIQHTDMPKEIGMLAIIFLPVVIVQGWISISLAGSDLGYTSIGPWFDILIAYLPNIACAIWLTLVTRNKALNTLPFLVLGLALGVNAVLIYLVCIGVQFMARRVNASPNST